MSLNNDDDDDDDNDFQGQHRTPVWELERWCGELEMVTG